MLKTFPALLTALAVTACASAHSADGDTLTYLRSNIDGTEPETVSVYLKDDASVEVYKHVSPCTEAALVTARIDPAADEATALTGGRLTRDGTQEAFAWLNLDSEARQLAVRFGAPDAETAQRFDLPAAAPWRLFDFDFADFNALARTPVPGEARSWFMALVWPDNLPDDSLQAMGTLTATWSGREFRDGVEAHRYALSGAGFDGGDLWLDARDGTVVEVRAPVPNHPGYTDYRLVLTGRSQGARAWAQLLASHWTGCAAD
jgi:hypothetical protein